MLASGAASALLASSMPAQYRKLALVGGLAGAGVGLLLLLRAAREAGGLVEAAGSIIAGEKPAVEEAFNADPLTAIVLAAGGAVPAAPVATPPGVASTPWAIPLLLEVLTPTTDSVVNPGVWSGTYKLTVRISNATNAPVSDVLTVEVDENYGLGSPERASVTTELETVPPRSDRIVTLNVPLGGGRIRFSRAAAIARVRFGTARASAGYYIDT